MSAPTGLVSSVPPQLHRASLRRSFRPQSGHRRQCGHGRSATSSTAHSQEGHQIWDVEAVDIGVTAFRPNATGHAGGACTRWLLLIELGTHFQPLIPQRVQWFQSTNAFCGKQDGLFHFGRASTEQIDNELIRDRSIEVTERSRGIKVTGMGEHNRQPAIPAIPGW